MQTEIFVQHHESFNNSKWTFESIVELGTYTSWDRNFYLLLYINLVCCCICAPNQCYSISSQCFHFMAPWEQHKNIWFSVFSGDIKREYYGAFMQYTHTYVCVSGGKKCSLFRTFCVRTKWMISKGTLARNGLIRKDGLTLSSLLFLTNWMTITSN